jgi:hypothetical protein
MPKKQNNFHYDNQNGPISAEMLVSGQRRQTLEPLNILGENQHQNYPFGTGPGSKYLW